MGDLICGTATGTDVIDRVNENSSKITTNETNISTITAELNGLIDDTAPHTDKVYSSQKIEAELSTVPNIDDTTPSATKTYSSQKQEATFVKNTDIELLPKAVLRYSGTAILYSNNIASATKVSNGILGVTFTNPMTDANYLISGNLKAGSGALTLRYRNVTANGFELVLSDATGASSPLTDLSVTIIGA